MKETITSSKPCVICGKPDYCYRLHFDDGGVNHCCARVHDESVFASGEEYVKIKEKDTNIGTYSYFQSLTERNSFLEKIKGKSKPSSNKAPRELMNEEPKEEKLLEGEVAVSNDDVLDKVYRRFLSLLVLENRDKEVLQKEWDTHTTEGLYNKLISKHPIKSLPPADYVRKRRNYKDGLRNLPRYKICKVLEEEFETLAGVPGFFRTEKYGWSFVGTEGILFPIYNHKGQIIRLRLRESYPETKGVYQGVEGFYHHGYDDKGNHSWTFVNKETKEEILVYDGSKQLISLKPNGCPAGKASSKYKNFSSVYEKKVDGKVVNGYGLGSRSGSNISLYCKDSDNFSTVYITEGEKKAMVANMLLGVPVISLPGTGTFSKLFETGPDGISMMEYLVKEKGTKLCVIAYDADKNTNIMVLKSEKKAIMEFLHRGISIAVGEWNAAFGKGLDDILVAGVRPSVFMCQ